MKKSMLILIGIFGLIISTILYFSFPEKGYDTNIEIVKITSIDQSSKLFIKKKTWGMTGDGQVIIISDNDNSEFEPDSTKDYIFKGLSPLFYKVERDTLILYTYKVSSVPFNLKSNFIIRQVELENPLMMNLIQNDNYKQQGLNIIK